MSYKEKYAEWISECVNIYTLWYKNVQRRQIAGAACVMTVLEKKQKKKYNRKRHWINPIFQAHHKYGFFHVSRCNLTDEQFKNYYRMTATQFELLLDLVAPVITKQTVIREPISAAERLSITLRYLAAGDSMTSISYHYLVGITTVANIIGETCAAIWKCLHTTVIPPTKTEENWLEIARDFEETWNFNHCIGAIDGKHIKIECPPNAGSAYFNYKNHHSIILLGICDAQYLFTFVDIGAYGRRSDGGIFRDSTIGQNFANKKMNLPDKKPLSPDGPPLPFVLVADEAFQLTDYLLRPYPRKDGLNQERCIYNYRLSRARRTIENTFGIIVSQWRILRRPINCSVDKTITIVQAIVCLHNWLRKRDIGIDDYASQTIVDRDDANGFVLGSWHSIIDSSALTNVNKCGSNNATREAIAIRNEFCKYFYSEGAIPWQFEYC